VRSSKCLLKRLTNRKLHVTEVSNASRTLLMNIKSLQWDPVLLNFFQVKSSVLPKIVSSSQVYGEVEHGTLKGIRIGGLIGDQQGALVGNKCFHQGEAKCTFGTGAFLLFNTGKDVVKSNSGLLGTVGLSTDGASRTLISP
jgi:glycerol kinase